MTVEPIRETNDPNGATGLPGPVAPGGVPVQAFSPLLRSLLSWELVRRQEREDGEHDWVLIDAAKQRLEELAPRSRTTSASLAYLDHWCARCREQRLTHFIDGRYVCESCQRIEDGTAPSAGEMHRSDGRHFELTSRRRSPRS